MNLPSGSLLRQAVNAKQADYKREVFLQANEGFSGYLVATVEGVEGIEEGALFYRDGKIVASVYEYLKHGVSVSSEEAARCCFNALASDYAVYDLVKLSNKQVDLVLALNEGYRLKAALEKNGVQRLFAKEFSTAFAERFLASILLQKRFSESKYHLLKKLGLHKLGN